MRHIWIYQAAWPGSCQSGPCRCVRAARADALGWPVRMRLGGPYGCVRAVCADVLGWPCGCVRPAHADALAGPCGCVKLG